jgi:hypothetical protein
MPTYDFKNLKTGEIETKIMSISSMLEYTKDANIEQVFTSPPKLVSGVKSVLSQAGDGWKEVQDKIKSGLPPRYRDNINTK